MSHITAIIGWMIKLLNQLQQQRTTCRYMYELVLTNSQHITCYVCMCVCMCVHIMCFCTGGLNSDDEIYQL